MSDEEKIRTQCPNCGQRMRLKAKFLGRTIKCPTCENPFTVEEDAQTADDAGAGLPDPPPPPTPAASGGEAFVDAPPVPPAVEDNDFATVPSTMDDDSMGAFNAPAPEGEGEAAMTYAQDQYASDAPPVPGVEVVSPYGPGTEMPPAVEPSKHFKNYMAPEQEVEQEYDLGGSGFIFRNRTRVAVTRDTVLVLRKKWWFFGIFPGSDTWFTEYPIFSRDLRRVRAYVPSAGRLALVFLLMLILSAFGWYGVTQTTAMGESDGAILRGLYDSLAMKDLSAYTYVFQEHAEEEAEAEAPADMDSQDDGDTEEMAEEPVEEEAEPEMATAPPVEEPADTQPETMPAAPENSSEPPHALPMPSHVTLKSYSDRLKPYDLYAWWWVLLPLALPILYYWIQRPAQLQTDAFKVPTGRDSKHQKAVRECAKYIVERRRGTTHVAY